MVISSNNKAKYILGILFTLLSVSVWRLGLFPSRTAPGLSILGVDLGHLSLENVEHQYVQIKESFETMPVVLKFKDQSITVTPRELGITIECDKNSLYKKYGFTGNPLTKAIDRIRSSIRGYKIPVSDCIKLNNTLTMDEIRDKVKIQVRNAYWEIGAEGDIPVESVVGQDVDTQKLITEIVRRYESRRISLNKRLPAQPAYIQLPIKRIEPRVKKADIAGMSVLGEFTTHFDPTVTGRVHNIVIAVDKILGTYIEPKKEWSLNNTVGPRDKSNGFEEALVIVDGEFVTGVGGGVSQVATTVYNAALQSGLDIKEHYTHTIPISYVPFGMDATAVYGKKDLILINTTSSLISLTGKVLDDYLTIKIYGFPENEYTYVISPRVLETFEPKVETTEDNSLPQDVKVVDRKGLPGYRLAIDRVTVDKDGKTIKQEEVTTGWYRMVPEKVRIGTKKVDKSEVKPEEEPADQNKQVNNDANSGVVSTFSRYLHKIQRALRSK